MIPAHEFKLVGVAQLRKIALTLSYLPVSSWLEVATFEVRRCADVRPMLSAFLGAPVRELVCALVGANSNVRRDPLDVDAMGMGKLLKRRRSLSS